MFATLSVNGRAPEADGGRVLTDPRQTRGLAGQTTSARTTWFRLGFIPIWGSLDPESIHGAPPAAETTRGRIRAGHPQVPGR